MPDVDGSVRFGGFGAWLPVPLQGAAGCRCSLGAAGYCCQMLMAVFAFGGCVRVPLQWPCALCRCPKHPAAWMSEPVLSLVFVSVTEICFLFFFSSVFLGWTQVMIAFPWHCAILLGFAV